MPCEWCGFGNADAARFCGGCGASLATECPACSAPLRSGLRFCDSCGTQIGPAPPETDALAGGDRAERRRISVIFVDLEDFTGIAESMDPEALRQVQSRYFEAARAAVAAYDGTIEKFIGDAVMAVWGAPAAHEDDAERAVAAVPTQDRAAAPADPHHDVLAPVYGTAQGVTLAMSQVLLPYMVLPLFSALGGIDRKLLLAARSLGSPPIVAFWKVYWPLSRGGVVAGMILVFTLACGFYVTPALIGSPRESLIAQLLGQRTTQLLDFAGAGALGTLVLVITLVLVAWANRVGGSMVTIGAGVAGQTGGRR